MIDTLDERDRGETMTKICLSDVYGFRSLGMQKG